LPDQLSRFGPSASSDSSQGESLHKYYKKDARRTSTNKETFEHEVGHRHHERILFWRAEQERERQTSKKLARNTKDVLGAHYRVNCDGMFDVLKTKNASKASRMKEVTQYVQKILLPHSATCEILLYGRCRHNGTLYRGINKKSKGFKNEWHDWVNVHWTQWGPLPIPARIITFVHIQLKEGECLTDPVLDNSSFYLSGVYALVHAIPESLYETPVPELGGFTEDGGTYLAHQCTRLIYKSGLATERSGRAAIYLVHVETMFCGPLVAVPYDLNDVMG
jgi:hypothetical protein